MRPASTVAEEETALKQQISAAFALMNRLRPCSQTAKDLDDDPDNAESAFAGLCIKTRSSAKSIAGAVRTFSDFLQFAADNQITVPNISESLIAKWIRHLRPRGKSVPQRGFSAIKWANETFRLSWNLDYAKILHRVFASCS